MESATEGSANARRPDLAALLLAHPLRVRIAGELAQQRLDPAQLADVLGEDLAKVRYHWRVLQEVGE